MDPAKSEVHAEGGVGLECSEEILSKIHEIIVNTRGQAGAVIRVLQQAQAIMGYLPPSMVRVISTEMKMPLAEVYGIISFYHFFSMVPKGKYVIQVCMGTSCYVKGSQRILDTLKKEWGLEPRGITPDGKFSLEVVRCLGCCAVSPVITVGGDVHKRVKRTQISDILNSYK